MSRPVSKVTAVPDLPDPASSTRSEPASRDASGAEDVSEGTESAETLDGAESPSALASDPTSEGASERAASDDVATQPQTPSPGQSRSGMGVLALLLGLLLLVSVAFNLKQSREIAVLDTRSQEFETALTAAVERIDSETLRAEKAESTLGGITDAVDTVHERIASLEEALSELREATAR